MFYTHQTYLYLYIFKHRDAFSLNLVCLGDFVQSRKFQSRSWQLFNVSLRWVRFLINSISIFFGLSANLNFVQKCVQVHIETANFVSEWELKKKQEKKKRTGNDLYVIKAIAACRSKFSACTGKKTNGGWQFFRYYNALKCKVLCLEFQHI